MISFKYLCDAGLSDLWFCYSWWKFQNWHSKEGMVYEEQAMPTPEALERSTYISNGIVFKRVSNGHATNTGGQYGYVPDSENSDAISSQSPFRTLPSLSYQYDKVTSFCSLISFSLNLCSLVHWWFGVGRKSLIKFRICCRFPMTYSW